RVVLLNDDYTPMEFVVDVLEKFFALNRPTATRIMLEVHTRGKGVCGVFTYEIAETKVAQVTTYARDHQHPLMCTLEEASGLPAREGRKVYCERSDQNGTSQVLRNELETLLTEAFHQGREGRHEYLTVEPLLLAILDTP